MLHQFCSPSRSSSLLPFSSCSPLHCPRLHHPIIHIVFASRQGEASSAAPELQDLHVMKSPQQRRPAAVCACGWVHRLGRPTSCPLAASTTGGDDHDEDSGAPSPALASSYAHRKLQPSYRWSILKTQARRRGIPCDVPFEEFVALIKRPCHYCGDCTTDRFRGLDRVDNDRGYTVANVVPCCPVCNYMKSKLAPAFFLQHTRRVALHNSRTQARSAAG